VTSSRPRLAVKIAIGAALVCGPVLAAALHRIHESGERRDLARAAARAWERMDYSGTIAWERVAPRPKPEDGAEGKQRFGFGGFGSRTGWSVRVSHSIGRACTEYKGQVFPAWRALEPSARFPDPAAWCLDTEAMLENYRASEPEDTAFQGRSARRFRLEPRIDGRPTLELTIDARTALPLKVATWDYTGNLYRVAAFRSVDVGDAGAELSRHDRAPYDFWGSSTRLEDARERVDFQPMLPEYLPEGFRLIDCRVRVWSTPRLRLTWSDGVTVFDIEQARIPTPAQMEHRMMRFGAERARAFVRRSQDWRLRSVLAADEGDSARATPVRCDATGSHRRYELWTEGLEIKLTGRADFDPAELIRVLQSLRQT